MKDNLINGKTEWIHSLSSMKKLFVSTLNDKDPRVTFITPYGIIIGEINELKEYNFSEEKIVEELENDPNIDPFALVESMHRGRAIFEDENLTVTDRDKRIYLKDVTIIGGPNLPKIHINTFMLFVDQIIGVLPVGLNGQD
ncbi:hypothetical protein [Fictibacillus nanhaiensis]|uniref:hypothetical protein n=1 Tax=Fictibacillus nanhaiensis TaxID=742169 RepID=UPI003C1F436C